MAFGCAALVKMVVGALGKLVVGALVKLVVGALVKLVGATVRVQGGATLVVDLMICPILGLVGARLTATTWISSPTQAPLNTLLLKV